MSKSPYYSISYYYNLKSFLGKNPLLWLIPFGTGYEQEFPSSNGYDFKINQQNYLNYLNIPKDEINTDYCYGNKDIDKPYKKMESNFDADFNTNVSNEKLNKSIDLNNISSKNHILIQDNLYFNDTNVCDNNNVNEYDNDNNGIRFNENLTSDNVKDSESSLQQKHKYKFSKDNKKDMINGIKK